MRRSLDPTAERALSINLDEQVYGTFAKRTRFFVFADTAAARSYAGGNECHAWLGVRFQHAFQAEPSDVVLHVRLLDPTNAGQQEAIGRLGVNLPHGALACWRDPRQMIEVLLDHVGRDRLEIDWITVRGPAFSDVDDRLLALHLVRLGFTPAVLFDPRGVRLYVQPTRDAVDGRVVTADTLRVAPHLAHLLDHLRVNGLIRPLPCDEATLRTYSSEDVRMRICSGDPSWRELVTPTMAALIEDRGFFGARCG